MNDTSTPVAGDYIGVITLIAVGQIIFGVDFCTVNVALATISRDLQVRPDILPWVVSTYSLTYAGFLVLGGRASAEQVRQPIYTEGLQQWRHFEAWLDPLKAALGTVLEDYPA